MYAYRQPGPGGLPLGLASTDGLGVGMATPQRLGLLGSWLPLELALDDFIGLRATDAAEMWLVVGLSNAVPERTRARLDPKPLGRTGGP